MVAPAIGRALDGCSFVCVPFAGGMSELLHIKARTLVVGDLNRHAINLALVLQGPKMGPALIRRLRRVPFHPDELALAQDTCRIAEDKQYTPPSEMEWAEAYFIASWMGRSGKAGTDDELDGKLSGRWNGNGGDSATRFRSATEGLLAYRKIMPRCTFQVMDAFEMLEKITDDDKNGIYCDPPWPDDGGVYKHKFGEAQQRRLAARLMQFQRARVVVRFGDHKLIRELYPETHWEWQMATSRTAGNNAKAEVLLRLRPAAERPEVAGVSEGLFREAA